MGRESLISIEETKDGYIIAPDVLCMPIIMVNICFIGQPGSDNWVLVDTALWNSAPRILEVAKERFGENKPPKAIILTHGHFDHIGALVDLIKEWKIPIYAHELEIPYLTGQKDYPPGDPTVDDGLIAKMSPLFPNESIDLGSHIKALPNDDKLSFLPGWRWIHTPGHTPGHISLFREEDSVLIAGDAITTVEQESALAVLSQNKELHGPPKYFTTDWQNAWNSVKLLEDLEPSVAATGHGIPIEGDKLDIELDKLAKEFLNIAMPDHSRYVPNELKI